MAGEAVCRSRSDMWYELRTSPVIHGALKIQNVLITEEYTKVANYELTVPLIRQMLLHVRYVCLTV